MNILRLTLFVILFLAVFVRFYRLDDLMMFIGDQGWFYISARDMLINGVIPLVGITSSHTWLHQGPLWTYILAPVLWLFDFNPVSGAYLAVFLGVVAVWVMYLVGKELFKNEEVGLISAFLFATSPLIVIHSRMSYHITPISLLMLLFILAIYKYVKGGMLYLPFAAFLLGILYNLELATMVFWILALIIFIIRKPQFKMLILSGILFLIPMIPMIIYDFVSDSNFYQTTAFVRLIKISIFSTNWISLEIISNIFRELFIYNQRLVFLGSGVIAATITAGSMIYIGNIFRTNYKKKKIDLGLLIILIWIVLALLGILVSKIASEAYLPMLYPAIILATSLTLTKITKRFAHLKTGIYVFIGFIGIMNAYLLITQDYLMRDKGYGPTFADRKEVARKIVSKAGKDRYNIVGKGEGSEFKNFTKNYEYITWWLGKAPSKKEEKVKFFIEEKNGKVFLVE